MGEGKGLWDAYLAFKLAFIFCLSLEWLGIIPLKKNELDFRPSIPTTLTSPLLPLSHLNCVAFKDVKHLSTSYLSKLPSASELKRFLSLEQKVLTLIAQS